MPRNEWSLWTDFIGLFVATGHVKGELAQSLMLVGEPGSGKSTMLARFYKVPSVTHAMDATAEGLKQQVFPSMIRNGQRHLFLPEFNKLMQRRGPTADNTIGILTLAMSGEMHDSYIGDKQLDKFPADFQVGCVGGMPDKVFADWRQTINNTGLIDRMVPVPFVFSPAMRLQILQAIARQDRRYTAPVVYAWPPEPVDINYSGSKIAPHVLTLAEQLRDKTPRAVRLMVSLVKAAALLERDSTVHLRHVDMVRQFLPLFHGPKK